MPAPFTVFHGLDPILTPERLARLVATNQVRFVMLGDLSFVSRRLGGETALKPMADWVRANGKPIEPALWRQGIAEDGQPSPGGDSRTRRMQLYDLRPRAGVVPTPGG